MAGGQLAMSGLIIDSFAGGGGASTGIEMALGRSPDVAINHDAAALAMHEANHPETLHINSNVWQVDPRDVTKGRSVALAWFSPDCKHFSKAKGGKPVQKNIRDLAWIVVLWAQRVRPAVICLENVEEFATWGPLLEDGMPCPDRRGHTFRRWTSELKKLGYRVEWRELRACDYGAPTIRKRLFLVARCDGLPIVWPQPTHAKGGAGGLQPWRTAAEIIDWSLPCPSIFLTREEGRAAGVNRPLAEATMARIAQGVRRFVLESASPFIVNLTHQGGDRTEGLDEPMRTITGAQRGEKALVAPVLAYAQHGGAVRSPSDPLHTITASHKDQNCLVAAFLAQHNTGLVGHDARVPVSTIVGKGCTQAVVAAFLAQHYTGQVGRPADEPLSTVTHRGTQQSIVSAFLTKYYGTDQRPEMHEPLHTVTTKDRFGLVTVEIAGQTYEIVDIGMRMLSARELFRAQGFPETYILDPIHNGRPLTKTEQIRMCGNSVCPQVAAALVRANAPAALVGARRAA